VIISFLPIEVLTPKKQLSRIKTGNVLHNAGFLQKATPSDKVHYQKELDNNRSARKKLVMNTMKKHKVGVREAIKKIKST